MEHSHTEHAPGILWHAVRREQCQVGAWHVCSALYLFIHSFSRECTHREAGERSLHHRSLPTRSESTKTLVMRSEEDAKLRLVTSECLKPAKGSLGALHDIIGNQGQYSAKRLHSSMPGFSAHTYPSGKTGTGRCWRRTNVQLTWKKEPSTQDLLFRSETSRWRAHS